ncbi:MAG: shikimate dehydrogenase [Anaerolineae bacterium]
MTGREVEGWGVRCPLSARQMLRLPPQVVYDRIVWAGRLAQRQGAGLLALGPLASGVGDGGVTIAQRLNMPVSTGNSLTVASAVAALEQAVELAGRRGPGRTVSLAKDSAGGRPSPGTATAAVVGASGSIGLGCAELLAPLVQQLILVGHREIDLSRARALVEAAGAVGRVRVSTRIDAIREADLVLSAGRAARPRILADHLKRNAIVCDVVPPGDVSPTVRRERPDVFLTAGGVVTVPGRVDIGLNLGIPAGQAYAYIAETMILALEGRYESYSLGQRVHRERVRDIAELARRHGFRLAP